MSAWKKPSRNTWVKKISTPARASCGMSTPLRAQHVHLARSACRACAPSPSRAASSSPSTPAGTASSGESSKLRRSWLAFAASRIRSSSSSRWRANSATTSRGFRRRPSAHRRSIRPAAVSSSATSFAIAALHARAQHLHRHLACRPAARAKCTCATEALATGSALEFCEHLRRSAGRVRFSISATASSDGERRHLVLQLRQLVGDVERAAGRAASRAPGRT